jgi:protein CWC15
MKEKLKQAEIKAVQAKDVPQMDLDDDVEDDDDDDDDDSSDDEGLIIVTNSDDAQELLNELEKIKQERLAVQMQKDQEELAEKEAEMEDRALTGNPLLAPSSSVDFGIKRRFVKIIVGGMMMLSLNIKAVELSNLKRDLLTIC